MTRAFIFPGQGAQAIGMGKDLADAYPAAKAVFDEVDDALGESLSKLIWDGDIETLTLTENQRRWSSARRWRPKRTRWLMSLGSASAKKRRTCSRNACSSGLKVRFIGYTSFAVVESVAWR